MPVAADRNVAVAAGRPEGQPPSGKAAARGSGGRGPLVRVTVNVTGRAARALDVATELTGGTKTDTVNRALQVYAYMEQVTAHGGSVYVREAGGSELELLKAF